MNEGSKAELAVAAARLKEKVLGMEEGERFRRMAEDHADAQIGIRALNHKPLTINPLDWCLCTFSPIFTKNH